METYQIGSTELEAWMQENNAVYTGDYVEGCLLDSFVVATDTGYAALYENYLNEWSSDYLVEEEPGSAPDVWARWEAFAAQAEVA